MPARKVFVSQVVFPHEIALLDRPAFLIGWNTEQFHCTIAGAVPFPQGEEKGEEDLFALLGEALRCSYADPNFVLSAHRKYPFPPIIVGQWLPSARCLTENPSFADTADRNDRNINKKGDNNNSNNTSNDNNNNDKSSSAAYLPEPRFQKESIWITLSRTASARVCVSSIFSLGGRYETACYLISFKGVQSDALQSLHLCDPMDGRTLELQPLLVTHKHTTTSGNKEHNAVQFWREKTELAEIVIQINAARDLMRVTEYYVEALLARRNMRNKATRPENDERQSTGCLSRSLSLFEKQSLRIVSLLSCPVDKLLTSSQVLQAELSKPVPWLTNACRALTWQRLFPTRNVSTKEAQLAPSSFTRPDSFENTQSSHEQRNPVEEELSSTTSFLLHNFTVYGFSFFLCEVNERLRDLRNALRLCACFALSWNVDSSFNAKIFLRVLSIATLVFVDVALGLLCARWLYTHAHEVIAFATECTNTLHERLFLENLQWLDHAPGGVKLNPLITHKLSKGIAIFIHDAYSIVFPQSSSTSRNIREEHAHQELIVWIVRCVVCSLSGAGLSLQLALLADLCSLLTMPFTMLHALFAFFLRYLSLFISSLWLLFWGQKHNILRKRIDTCEADREQLLMAMILFFIAVFVWPSFCAYYLLLALLRVLVLLLICVPWQCVVLLREFPFVPVILFVREKLCRFAQRVTGVPRDMLSECDHLLSDGVQISLTHVEGSKSSPSLSSSTWAEHIAFRSIEQSERDIYENKDWNGVSNDRYGHSNNEESRENEDRDAGFGGGTIISEHSLRKRDLVVDGAMRSKPVSTLSRMTQQEMDSVCDEASDATFPSANDVQTLRSQYEYRDIPAHNHNNNHVWQWQSTKNQLEQTTAMFELKAQRKSFLSLFSSYREWIRFLFLEHRVFSNLLLRICQSETLFLRIINLTLIFYHQKQRRMEVAVSAMVQQNDQLLSVGKPSITFRESMSVHDITRLCQASDISETLSASSNQCLSANPLQKRWNLLLLLLVVVMTVFYLFFAIVGNILSLVVHVVV